MHAARPARLIRGMRARWRAHGRRRTGGRSAIDAYGQALGLAFQIVDDILDVEGASADLGKTAGKDAAAGKPTYPALYGLAESRRLAADCVDRALRRARHRRTPGNCRPSPLGHRPQQLNAPIEEDASGSTRCSSSGAWPRRANARAR